MENLFFTVLGMSLTGSFVILFVLLARLALRKAPRVFSYALWAVALFRLLCPFTLDSAFSLLPSAQMVSAAGWGGGTDRVIQVHTGIPVLNSQVNGFLVDHPYQEGQPAAVGGSPEEGLAPVINQLGPVPDWRTVPAAVWLAGCAALLGYSLLSLLRLRWRLVGSVPLAGEKRVRLADHIPSPFVLGLFRPVIYLPSDLSEGERDYILLHERAHIRRLDHITRALAWLAVAVHWFNPLVWLAFHLAGRDMEMSCDEAVLEGMGRDIRADYSTSLLRLSQGGKLPAGPLAFGGGDPQGRIKNILSYKKPAFWVAALALIGVLCLGVGLATDPSSPADASEAEAGLTCAFGEDGASVVVTGHGAERAEWYCPGGSYPVTEWGAQGYACVTGAELDGWGELICYAWWSGEDRNAVSVELVRAPAVLDYTALTDHAQPPERAVIERRLSGGEGLPQPSDEELVRLARRFAEYLRLGEEFYANARPADDTGIDLAFTMAQVNSGPFLRVAGKVYGRELRRAVWSPEGADALFGPHPGGELTMEYDFERGGASVAAWWADEERTQVAVTTKMSAYLSSYMPSGWWEFTVDLSGEQGRVASMEAMGGENTLPDPVKMFPEAITDQEAVLLARIAAKTMTAAEDFYHNYDGPIPPAPTEAVRYTPEYSVDENGEYIITGLGDAMALWIAPGRWEELDSLRFYQDPAFFCPRLAGRGGEGRAWWTDGDRKAVGVRFNCTGEGEYTSGTPGFVVEFTADLETGAVTGQEFSSHYTSPVDGETLELSQEEMAYAAQVFAQLMRGAREHFGDVWPAP